MAAAALAQDGRQAFATRCSLCHGVDGRGAERGPNLANNRRVRSRSADELRAVIRNGIPASGMPAFDLPSAELNALTGFVRSLSAPASESSLPGDRAAGERFFFGKGACAQCHMALGRGKAVGPDLSSVGREMTVDEIDEAVRQPSTKIKPGYEVVRARLRDGRAIRGFARNQSRYSIQVQDLTGKFHLLWQSQVAELIQEPGSLMPAPNYSEDERRDVLAYLSSLSGMSVGSKAAPMESSGGLTFDQIAHPKPGDWPSYHGNPGGNRYSALDQINASNVKNLVTKWVFPINHFVVEATPVVVDGVMFVTGPNQVFALDAQSGRTIWHYQRDRSREVTGDPGKGTNRGVAVLGDRVFFQTDNAHMVALHRVSGALLWDSKMPEGPQNNNYGSTSAPLVVKDLVIGGVAGGDQGVRGFLAAYNVATGERAWRFWTVPLPGEPKSETWQGTALARFGGGGATWMTGTYDHETDTLFWGVGNPYPAYNGDERRGDNLYTASVLALKPDSGELKWYYQFTPHDLHDWDGGQTPMVVNAPFGGRERKLLIQANRNGFFYVLDRASGELLLGPKIRGQADLGKRHRQGWPSDSFAGSRPGQGRNQSLSLGPRRNELDVDVVQPVHPAVLSDGARSLRDLRQAAGLEPPSDSARAGQKVSACDRYRNGKASLGSTANRTGGQLGRRAFDCGRCCVFRGRQRGIRGRGRQNRQGPMADADECIHRARRWP